MQIIRMSFACDIARVMKREHGTRTHHTLHGLADCGETLDCMSTLIAARYGVVYFRALHPSIKAEH